MRKGLWRHVGLGGEEPSPTATINVHLGRETEGSDHCHLGAAHRSAMERKNSRTKEGFVDAAGCPATEPTEFWLGVGRVAEGREKGGARMVVNQWLTVYSMVASVSHACLQCLLSCFCEPLSRNTFT